jgi:hypothetical protein
MNRIFYGLVRTCAHTHKSEIINVSNNTKELQKNFIQNIALKYTDKKELNSFENKVCTMNSKFNNLFNPYDPMKVINKEVEKECFEIMKTLNSTNDYSNFVGKYEIYKMEKVEKSNSNLRNLFESDDFHTSFAAAIGSIVGVGIIFGVYSILK